MNLRILKKLSKRAAELIRSGQVPTTRHHVMLQPSDKWEGYTDTTGHDRKHWDRCYSVHATSIREDDIVIRPRHDQHWVHLSEPNTALKGTMMAAWESRGMDYCEWEEHTAWEELLQRVEDIFTDYHEVPNTTPGCPIDYDYVAVPLRTFRNPSDVFRAVPDLIAECARQQAERSKRMGVAA